jgi:hypothetical protein
MRLPHVPALSDIGAHIGHGLTIGTAEAINERDFCDQGRRLANVWRQGEQRSFGVGEQVFV